MAQQILVAFDLDEGSGRALQRGLQLQAQWAAPLTALHIVDEGMPERLAEEERRQARARMAALVEPELLFSKRTELLVESGIVEEGLLAAAEARDAAVIVAGPPRQRSIVGLFLGSTIERLLRYGPYPVLVVRRSPEGAAYRRVCFAVDEGPASVFALQRTVGLGLLEGASVWAAHGVRARGKMMMVSHAGVEQRDVAEHVARTTSTAALGIERLLREACPDGPAFSLIVREGDPVTVIEEVVAAMDIDLLVVGTRGATGLKRLLLGSTAEALIARAPCDVLAIPAVEGPPS